MDPKHGAQPSPVQFTHPSPERSAPLHASHSTQVPRLAIHRRMIMCVYVHPLDNLRPMMTTVRSVR